VLIENTVRYPCFTELLISSPLPLYRRHPCSSAFGLLFIIVPNIELPLGFFLTLAQRSLFCLFLCAAEIIFKPLPPIRLVSHAWFPPIPRIFHSHQFFPIFFFPPFLPFSVQGTSFPLPLAQRLVSGGNVDLLSPFSDPLYCFTDPPFLGEVPQKASSSRFGCSSNWSFPPPLCKMAPYPEFSPPVYCCTHNIEFPLFRSGSPLFPNPPSLTVGLLDLLAISSVSVNFFPVPS